MFIDRKKLKIPEVVDKCSLFDFIYVISIIDSSYVSTQEYFINQKARNSKKLPELYDLVEDFRNHYRRTEALKSTSSHSAFATLNGENQEGEKPCLCGGKHSEKQGRKNDWYKCEYITPKNRPNGWKGKPEIFNKINQVLKTWEEGKVKWFVNRFKYDGLKDLPTITS